jgi:pimeloyl-ACP methyl ester carboxylesterase
VLTIHGTKDRDAPCGAGRECVATLPSARLLTLRGGAHDAWVEFPEEVFPAVDSFLNGARLAGAERPPR